ncbi:MAG: sulfate transporter CysZ [Motiliproteus sp.]
MGGNPLRGAAYLIRGLQLLNQPGLRRFVIIPLLINSVLFSIAIYLLTQYFSGWVNFWLDWIPDWLNFIDWLLWPLFALLVMVSVYFTFGLLANFIAAPFNGLLAERVEQRLRGVVPPDENWKALLATVPHSLNRELAKLAYYLPRLLLLLVLSFIPLIGPLLWFLFGAWMMAIQFCDYPMDNNKIRFGDMKQLLQQKRLSSLGFGALVSLAMLIPVLNLLVMPAAVIGATLFWVEEYAGSQQADAFSRSAQPSQSPRLD